MILVCKHGHRVTVHISTYSPICWDDGILTYDKSGHQIQGMDYQERDKVKGEYLEVSGCKYCTLIQLKEN